MPRVPVSGLPHQPMFPVHPPPRRVAADLPHASATSLITETVGRTLNPDEEKIRQIVVDIIATQLKKVDIKLDSIVAGPYKTVEADSCRLDLGADSLDLEELAMKFEERFEIEFTYREMVEAKTVYDIIKKIASKKNELNLALFQPRHRNAFHKVLLCD